MRSRTAAFPGTCGELFQGTLGGVPCLVSCPIDRMARLKVTEHFREGVVLPPEMSKTKKALELVLGKPPFQGSSLKVERLSALPEGKGYASSTADILAALYGLAALSDVHLSPEAASRMALAVEPTDSIAWPGLALLDHREGRIMEFLGSPPPVSVFVLDWGGTVDTEEFNRRNCREALAVLAPLHREAFALIRTGVERCDPEALGRGASLSAEASRRILEKPRLDECFSLCASLDGYGVCVAHSGTLYGLLLPAQPSGSEKELAGKAARALSPGWEGRLHALVSGGPRMGERGDGP